MNDFFVVGEEIRLNSLISLFANQVPVLLHQVPIQLDL